MKGRQSGQHGQQCTIEGKSQQLNDIVSIYDSNPAMMTPGSNIAELNSLTITAKRIHCVLHCTICCAKSTYLATMVPVLATCTTNASLELPGSSMSRNNLRFHPVRNSLATA